MRTRLSGRKRSERGQNLVEAALVIIVFLVTFIAVFDFAQVLFFHQAMTERVRAAVRWAVVRPYNEAEIQNFVLFYSPTAPGGATSGFLGLTPANVKVDHLIPGAVIGSATYPASDAERIRIHIDDFKFYLFTPYLAKTFTNNSAIDESLPMEYRP